MFFYYLFCCLSFKKHPSEDNENEKHSSIIKNKIKTISFDSVSSSASTVDLQIYPSPDKNKYNFLDYYINKNLDARKESQ